MSEIRTTSLIWIDSAPLIQAEHRKYLAAVRKLNEARVRLEFHSKSDEPKYSHWLQTEFADQLGNIRALHHRFFELEAIVASVEDYMRQTGASVYEAYESYLEAKEMADLVREMEMEKQKSAREKAASDSSDGESQDSSDDGSENGRGHQHEDANNSRRFHDREAPSMRKHGKKAQEDEAAIKQIYRQLARRLHPDINGGLSDHEKELWFEVQMAYDDRDLARLESLLAMAEREAEENGEIRAERVQSLGRLKSMLKNLGRKLKATQRSLSKAKKSAAWDFHKVKADPRKMSKLRLDITIEFQHVEQGLGSDVRRYEKQIARWERAVKRKQSRGLDGYEDLERGSKHQRW